VQAQIGSGDVEVGARAAGELGRDAVGGGGRSRTLDAAIVRVDPDLLIERLIVRSLTHAQRIPAHVDVRQRSRRALGEPAV
jgi:hypothetical protein